MIHGIYGFLRLYRILECADPRVICHAITQIAIIVQKCRKQHIHACSVTDSMSDIQEQIIVVITDGPQMIVGVLAVQSDFSSDADLQI